MEEAALRQSNEPRHDGEAFMGKDAQTPENAQMYERARKIAKNKISFIRHLITYAAVILVLALINNVTNAGRQWWLWVALFWGIGVFFNFLNAFIFKG